MRKLSPAFVVTSIVVAIAGAFTQAQAATKSAGAIVAGSMRSGSAVTATSATGMSSAAPAAPTGTNSGTGSPVKLSNTTTVDVRNAQTMDATAVTRQSGPSPFTSGGATPTTAPGSSSTLPVTGTTGGGVLVGGTDVTGATAMPVTNLGNPLVFNGAVGSDLAAESLDQGNGVAIVGNTPTAADYARSSVSLDRVIKSAERDRRKAGRNGQLLYSIAPRTSVDRSNEMPDDGPTPALRGLATR